MDLALQKAAEVGVTEISPVFTEYCGVKIAPQRMENKLRHWQRILISAVEQSGRLRVPRLNLPVELMQLPAAATNSVSDSPASTTPTQTTADRGCLALMLEPSATDYLPPTLPDKVQIFIGPEGGFSPNELKWAKAQGVQLANLGTAILRTETAPAATLAILHHIHRTQ